MLGRGDEDGRVIEERREIDTGEILGIGGHDEIHLFAVERRHGAEGQTRTDIDIDFGPGLAELFEHREQPFEAGVALDGDVQTPRLARAERREILFQRLDLGQDFLGQFQQPVTRCGQL